LLAVVPPPAGASRVESRVAHTVAQRRFDAVSAHCAEPTLPRPAGRLAGWGFHLGLRRADDSPKPAFCALAALRRLPCR
jgi:hypothetical protein